MRTLVRTQRGRQSSGLSPRNSGLSSEVKDRLRERVGGGGVSNYADANEKLKTKNLKLW